MAHTVRKDSDITMATAEATREFSAGAKDLGEKIIKLTLKEAKELSDYLEEVHGIKPAAGGAVMMAPAGGGGGAAPAAEAKTEFDVVLEGFGDKKIGVIKVVRARYGVGPERSQGLGRRRSEQGQGRDFEGRRGEAQEGVGRSWRDGIDQVAPVCMDWTVDRGATVRVALARVVVACCHQRRPGSSENLPLHESLDSTRQATVDSLIRSWVMQRFRPARQLFPPTYRHLNLGATKAYGHHGRTTPAS